MRHDYCDITIVLDRSGSMNVCRNSTIEGFNKFLEEQKNQPGYATISLTQFDHEYEIVYSGKSIREAPRLSCETYVPRGTTALLDAMGRTIVATGNRLRNMPEHERPSKVLFVVITDGQENDSVEFTRSQVFDMITHQREKYSWCFVFIGANQDAIATAQSYGVPITNAMNFCATPGGVRSMAAGLTAAVNSYRGCSARVVDGFFCSSQT